MAHSSQCGFHSALLRHLTQVIRETPPLFAAAIWKIEGRTSQGSRFASCGNHGSLQMHQMQCTFWLQKFLFSPWLSSADQQCCPDRQRIRYQPGSGKQVKWLSPLCKETPNSILWSHQTLLPTTDTSSVSLAYQNRTHQWEQDLWKCSAAAQPGNTHSTSAKKHCTVEPDAGSTTHEGHDSKSLPPPAVQERLMLYFGLIF